MRLRQKVKSHLEAAYGLGSEKRALDAAHGLEPDEQIVSLDHAVAPPIPSGANLGQAVDQLLEAALAAQYPGHPRFDPDARTSGVAVKRVWAILEEALQSPEGRSPVEAALRKDVKLLAEPLKLVTMGETHLVLNQHWRHHFVQKEAQHGGPMTVGKLRRWMDEPQPMGIPPELQSLIILFFAGYTNRSFVLHGGAVQPALDGLRDEMELREQPLPPEATWAAAMERAQAIFGLTPGAARNAANVARLAGDIQNQCSNLMEGARSLVHQLQTRLRALGIQDSQSLRLVAASDGLNLVEAIRSATESQVIAAFARAPLQAAPLAVGTTLRKAREVAEALTNARWALLESATSLTDFRQAAGEGVATRLRELLIKDEQLIGLAAALRSIEDDAARLLADKGPAVPPPRPSSPPPPRPPKEGPSKALRLLYGRSQVSGDPLPQGVPADRAREVLEIHYIVPVAEGGREERRNMMVVTPTMNALIAHDPGCQIDLAAGTMRLYGVELRLEVDPRHNG